MGSDSRGAADEQSGSDQAAREAAERKVDAILAEIDLDAADKKRAYLAEQHDPSMPYLVYRLFDHDWSVAYVGATRDFMARMLAHMATRWWVDIDVEVIVTEKFGSAEDAAEREQELIAILAPRHNVEGNGRRKYRSYR
jgi:predicted GIY-YIG superfamily endonuclease